MKPYTNIEALYNSLQYSEKFSTEKESISLLKNTLKNMLGDGEVYIDKNLASMIERTPKLERSTQRIMDDLNKYLGKWKTAKLFNVGFPVRNLLGDSTNLYVAGMPANKIVSGAVSAMEDVPEIMKLQNVFAKNKLEGLDGLANMTPRQAELYKEWDKFVETGITAQTRTKNEFGDVIKALSGESNPQNTIQAIKNNTQLKKFLGMTYDMSTFFDISNRFNAWRWANSEDGLKIIKDLGYEDGTDFI
ncbi:MAG: hypothetical protein RR490_08135, partial [Niameybacter sp.]